MATKGLLAKIGSLNEDKVADDGSFTFADSAAQYTTVMVEMDFTGNTSYKRYEHLLTINNLTTDSALTVDVYNVIEDPNGLNSLARIDTFSAGARGAVSDPAYVYYWDQSATTFTGDQTDFVSAGANDVSVPGHAAAEVNDALYIGHTEPFNQLLLTTGTAKTDVSTLVMEYYNGTSWSTLSTDVDINDVVEDTAGTFKIEFDYPSDWSSVDMAAGAGGGDNPTVGYYVRIRCSAFTSAETQGLLTDGAISEVTNDTVYQRAIKGLFMGTERVVVGITNDTSLGTTALDGSGGFTGFVRIEAL
jgi:hypothetical protein